MTVRRLCSLAVVALATIVFLTGEFATRVRLAMNEIQGVEPKPDPRAEQIAALEKQLADVARLLAELKVKGGTT